MALHAAPFHMAPEVVALAATGSEPVVLAYVAPATGPAICAHFAVLTIAGAFAKRAVRSVMAVLTGSGSSTITTAV